MIRAWQQLPNTSSKGRFYDVEIPGMGVSSRTPISNTVVGCPRGYELDSTYVDNDFFRCLVYLCPEDGNEFSEDVNDYYAYVEVYPKRSGRCPERPAFVYVADTPRDYVELVTFVSSSGGVRRRREEDFDY